MKVHDCPQGSNEWLLARSKCATCSELTSLITPGGKLRGADTDMPRKYLAQKVAERWLGEPLDEHSAWVIEQGKILEEEAVPRLQVEWDTEIHRPGFYTTDDGSLGCSPDGAIGNMGIEIKCPQPENHVKYLLAGVCPPDYWLQVQGGLFVTGWKLWRFVSYRRNFPLLIVDVEPHAPTQEIIGEAVAAFAGDLESAYARVVQKNGGRPPKVRAPRPEAPSVD